MPLPYQEALGARPFHVRAHGRTRGGRGVPTRRLQRRHRGGVPNRGCVIEAPGAGQGVLHGIGSDGSKVRNKTRRSMDMGLLMIHRAFEGSF